ncbi:20731_t:CDS:2 [Racocetra persica]|uniref:20731_t:CDS:1 n=1 Tax=Racocetra persica TaxID=160502 RepID=A0ACA9KTS1_9GLOM|nr:20731_t:CDS:2 [Racocetra persica]
MTTERTRYTKDIQISWQCIIDKRNNSNKRKYFNNNKENFEQLPSKKFKNNPNSLKNCIDSLLTDHNIEELCIYVQSKLKNWIKKGNLYEDRELVTKILFHALLSDLPNYLVDTEIPIEVYRNKVKVHTFYADLSVVELKATNNAKLNRFIFEFKNKNVNFLDLKVNGNNNKWEILEEKAKKIEKMSENEIRQLKCSNSEKFDKGKTIQTIFNEACQQLLNYVNNLRDDNYQTSAFVVMSVGSRKLIWEKVN